MRPFYKCNPVTDEELEKLRKELLLTGHTVTLDQLHAMHDGETIVKNDKYQVVVKLLGEDWVHLSIKRIDRNIIHDWRELQEIKNLIVGEDCEGLELYPAESRLVDNANQYHLFVNRDPTFRLPWGFHEGRSVTEVAPEGVRFKQRPRVG